MSQPGSRAGHEEGGSAGCRALAAEVSPPRRQEKIKQNQLLISKCAALPDTKMPGRVLPRTGQKVIDHNDLPRT